MKRTTTQAEREPGYGRRRYSRISLFSYSPGERCRAKWCRTRWSRLDLEDLTATGTQLRFFSPQAANDPFNVGNFPGAQSEHIRCARNTLLFGAPVFLCRSRA